MHNHTTIYAHYKNQRHNINSKPHKKSLNMFISTHTKAL